MPLIDTIKDFLPFTKPKQSDGSSHKHLGLTEKMQLVNFVMEEFDAALNFTSEDEERQSKSWKLFTGHKYGQWPDSKMVNAMLSEGRNPFQGNFIQRKVEGLAGNIIKNFYDVGFEPINGGLTELTRYVALMMMIDKELMNWNASYKDFVIDGLVHLGIEEMFISDRYDPLGNIGFRRLLPGSTILDPNWLTNDSWELKRAWKCAFLTPKQIKEVYDTKSEEIDSYVRMGKGDVSNFDNGPTDKGTPHFGLNEQYGDKYRVIEFKHMEREKQKFEVHLESGMTVPEGPNEFVQEWASVNGIDLDSGVVTRTENVDVLYVTTVCPQISRSLVLEDKKSKIQIGRLDIFPWSSGKYNGKNSGLPELLESIQTTYNKRESLVDFIIASSSTGGIGIDPEIVGNDNNKLRAMQESFNKPNFKFFTEPGALASGRNYFTKLPTNEVNFAIVNELSRMIDMADRISPQPTAMEGRSEGSEETGILFARKTMQAEVAQTVLLKGLEQHWNEKGEAYLLLAKSLYSGVYREFTVPGTGEKIELNRPVITPSGEVIENDIATLPRMRVMVTQSPEGVTNRTVDRTMNLEMLRVLGPESPIQRARASANAIKTLNLSKAEKMQIEQDAELEVSLAREQVVTNLMGLKSQQMQLQMQMMQAGQPQVPVTGAPDMQQQGPEPQGSSNGNPEQDISGSNQAMMDQNLEA